MAIDRDGHKKFGGRQIKFRNYIANEAPQIQCLRIYKKIACCELFVLLVAAGRILFFFFAAGQLAAAPALRSSRTRFTIFTITVRSVMT